jgi:formylglycine-generating enzyme required for sulfatase activity
MPISKEPLATYAVEPFSISKYPVTYEQFNAFIRDGGYGDDRWWQGLGKRPVKAKRGRWPVANNPRECVTWYEAIAFCRWLSDKLAATVVLPTEMQWQRAAQADDKRKYAWGNEFDPAICNTYESRLKKTTPVDQYPAGISAFGAMDMCGNVWEWCLNEHDHPDQVSLDSESTRTIRGGSWFNGTSDAQTTFRAQFRPLHLDANVGFRIVMLA